VKDNKEVTVSGLTIYPVKSLQGITLKTMKIGEKGPEMDRRFMVVDASGRFLTMRTLHRMCLIGTELLPGKLLLRARKLPPLIVKLDRPGSQKQVTVWKDTVLATDMGQEASEWFTEALGQEVHLVFIPDDVIRLVDPQYATTPQDQVSFADAYPIHLISEASLGDLNFRLKTPVPMNRFRPNIVVSGCEPYEEDTWKKIRIGNVILSIVKPCSRCVATTVDQASGERSDEPLATLAKYRKQEKGIMFGQNCIQQNAGSIALGDEVEILE